VVERNQQRRRRAAGITDDRVTAAEVSETLTRLDDNGHPEEGGYSASWADRSEWQWAQRIQDELDCRGITDPEVLLAQLDAEENEVTTDTTTAQRRGYTDEELTDIIRDVAEQTGQDAEFNELLHREIERRGR
jgi:hypothetical protein